MAIFHMRAQVISRSAGRSAIAAAAYRAGERLRDERTGQMHDYSRKAFVEHREILAPGNAPAWMHDRAAYRAGERLRDERTGQMHDYSRKAYVEHREILVPENAPAWMHDRAALWSGVEAAEKRKDAQLAREVHFSLPRELDKGQRIDLIREFCQREFVARGMIADVAIHNPSGRDGGEQPHAHVMLTTRVLTGEGFGPKERDWNDKAMYEGWRERWADHANRSLERIGRGERIDHRSFAARGIDREPEPKLGPKAARLERHEQQAAANENRPANVVTERGQEWRAVQERNRRRDELRGRIEVIARGLQRTAQRALNDARERFELIRAHLERAAAVIRDRFTRERPASEIAVMSKSTVPDALTLNRLESPPERMRSEARHQLFGRDPAKEADRPNLKFGPERRNALLGRHDRRLTEAPIDRAELLGEKRSRDVSGKSNSDHLDLLGKRPSEKQKIQSSREKSMGRDEHKR